MSDIGRFHKFESVPYVGTLGDISQPGVIAPPNGWALRLVARTNPSRPVITPPEMLQNLIELPRMVKHLGDLLNNPLTSFKTPSGVASEYLGIKFGWIPVINDVLQLLDLQKEILKRNAELQKLYSGRGLKRRVKFATSSDEGKRYDLIPLLGTVSVIARTSVKIERECWGSIRWKPTSPPPYHPQDMRFNDHTRNLVLGFTPEGMAKGLWNVIPWTWLLGWFFNIGDYALAHSNSVPAQYSSACCMSKMVVSTVPTEAVCPGGFQVELKVIGSATAITRTRVVAGTLVPGFNMPLWDISKLSVLGALFAQRFLR